MLSPKGLRRKSQEHESHFTSVSDPQSAQRCPTTAMELPLVIVGKCIEDGAEQLATNGTMQLDEIGDCTDAEMSYDLRFGALAQHLNALVAHANRPLRDLLPSIFTAGLVLNEPKYMELLARRTVNVMKTVNSGLTRGNGSSKPD